MVVGAGEEWWIGKIFREENRQEMNMYVNEDSEGQGGAKEAS